VKSHRNQKSLAAAVVVAVFLSLWAVTLSAQIAMPADSRKLADKPNVSLSPPKDAKPQADPSSSLFGWIGSLLVVLGLFLAAVWLIRRTSPRTYRLLPAEVFEVLGRAPLASRQQVHLLRCGNKLLLIAATVAGVEPLAEIVDPDEVEHLTELCRKSRPSQPAASLAQMFRKKEKLDG
jgi:flagellar protein FliO/FliZ